MTRSHTLCHETGGTLRPVAETIAEVVVHERARGVDRDRRAGLTGAEEWELLAEHGR